MLVNYSIDGKHAFFDGRTFTRDNRTGYYLETSGLRQRLHVAVYERCLGELPAGKHVHHVDMDKRNNEPDNLVALSATEHEHIHGKAMTEDQRQRHAKLVVEKALPKATEWHKSEAGKEWHKQHGAEVARNVQAQTYTCANCGKTFIVKPFGINKFCSNACKSAYRRKSGVDDVVRVCAQCGKEFRVNKYAEKQCCSRSCARRFWYSFRQNKAHNEAIETACVQHGG